MTKKTTDMTVSQLATAVGAMSDDDLRAAFLAETTTEGHTERAGAVEAITKEADKRGEPGIYAPAVEGTKDDAALSAATPGASPAVNPKPGEAEAHAETIAALTARVDELEKQRAAASIGDGEEGVREAVLKAFRQIEHIANSLNIQLPA